MKIIIMLKKKFFFTRVLHFFTELCAQITFPLVTSCVALTMRLSKVTIVASRIAWLLSAHINGKYANNLNFEYITWASAYTRGAAHTRPPWMYVLNASDLSLSLARTCIQSIS